MNSPPTEIEITTIEQGDSWVVVVYDNTTTRGGITDFCLSPTSADSRAMHHAHLYFLPLPPNRQNYPGEPQRRFPEVIVDFVERPNAGLSDRVAISLSAKAWEFFHTNKQRYGYAGSSRTTGVTHYMHALIKANPDPSTWTDTRPTYLKDADAERKAAGQLPYWSEVATGDPDLTFRDKRKPMLVNQNIREGWFVDLLHILSRHFLIAPYRGGSINNPFHCATAVLEAIGCGYLTARNPANLNSRPVDPNRQAQRHKTHRTYGRRRDIIV